MNKTITLTHLEKPISLLKHCLENQATPESMRWLESKIQKINQENTDSVFFMAFSAMPNYFNKDILQLKPDDLKQAKQIHKYWSLNRWSLTNAARVYLILNYIEQHPDNFKAALDKIFNAADIYELIALYQAIYLFPNPEKFLLHGTNGIRSNMVSVFEAIALNNPYPLEYFNETAWNQLVLKTLHIDSPIEQVIGLKQRANPALCNALINTARERFAAGRPIKPELWYLIGVSLDQKTLPPLKELLEGNSQELQLGALLALNYSKLQEAKALLEKNANKNKEIETDLNKLNTFDKSLG